MAEMGRMTAARVVDKVMSSEHADLVRESVAWLVGELMDAEVAAQIGAELGEVWPERVTHRNGYPYVWLNGKIETQPTVSSPLTEMPACRGEGAPVTSENYSFRTCTRRARLGCGERPRPAAANPRDGCVV